MPAVLVTGAGGFVGNHLAHYITRKGCNARLCVLHRYSYDKLILGADYFPADLDNYSVNYTNLLNKIDVVIHLAGKAHSKKYTKDEIYRSNYESTARLFDACIVAGVKRFIYLSSAKIYEKNIGTGQDYYTDSKLQAEEYLNTAGAEHDIEVVILRSPLVYGPGVKANFLKLMQMIRLGLPLPFKAIVNRRSFVYVENLCDLLYACICRDKMNDRVILCVKDWDVSTPELIRMLARHLGVPARLFPCPGWLLNTGFWLLGQKENLARLTGSLVVDDSYTRKLLEWTPPVLPEVGIRRTVMWFKERMND